MLIKFSSFWYALMCVSFCTGRIDSILLYIDGFLGGVNSVVLSHSSRLRSLPDAAPVSQMGILGNQILEELPGSRARLERQLQVTSWEINAALICLIP